MAQRYGPKNKVWVDPINGVAVAYVFSTGADSNVGFALGHKPIASLTKVGVAGAQAPKPARMAKDFATGTESSFVDWQSYNTAIAQDFYQVEGPKVPPSPRQSTKSTLVGALVATNIIGVWNMTQAQIDKITVGALSGELGITKLTQNDVKKAVVGANKWYNLNPPGAAKKIGTSTISVRYAGKNKLGTMGDQGWKARYSRSSGDPRQAVA